MDFRGGKLTHARPHFWDGKVHRFDGRRGNSDLRRNLRCFSSEAASARMITRRRIAGRDESVPRTVRRRPARGFRATSATAIDAWERNGAISRHATFPETPPQTANGR